MNNKEKIEKMHKETCVKELKKASKLNGNETFEQLVIILEKCECIRAAILLNGFKGSHKEYSMKSRGGEDD